MYTVGTDQRCPCGNSDAFAFYSDGHGKCFSHKCGQKFFPPRSLNNQEDNNYMDDDEEVQAPKDTNVILPSGEYSKLDDRNISLETCRKFGVTVKKNKGIITHRYYPYQTIDGTSLVKTKDCEAKRQKKNGIKPTNAPYSWTAGRGGSKVQLFGQSLFGKGSAKAITLVEGEDDALAAYELLGSRYPVVSVPDGADKNAIRAVKDNFEYLNSFGTIVVCLDNDAAGQSAVKPIAKLFPGKAKIMRLAKGKDAAEYLEKFQHKDFVNEWWQADLYTPDGIITGKAFLDALFAVPTKGVPICWDTLSGKTHGIRKHELWTFGGGTASGKTEVFKEIGYDLMVNHDKRCGFIMLEEPPERTIQCLVGKDINKRIYLEDVDMDGTERRSAPHLDKIADLSVIYNHQGMSDFENIKEKIEYFVTALGCEYIFLDHITAMAEGKEGDVNAKCHYIMEELNRLLQSKDFSLFLISHLRKATGKPAEEGGRVTLDDMYGSGAIKQRSNFVFSIEGNMQADDPDERNIRHIRCLKDRNTGSATGNVVPLKYDHGTGRLSEFDEEIEELYSGIK
jgi:twinkle protein